MSDMQNESVKVGFQQIMIGGICKNYEKALAVLKAAKSAGYDYIELNDFMVQKSPFIVKLLTKLGGMPVGNCGALDWHKLVEESGLKVSAMHSNLGAIEADPKAVAGLAKSFGTTTVVITGMYRFDYSDYKAVKELADRLNAAGKVLKQEEVKLLYHNHNVELQKVTDKETAYDIIIANTDSDYVNFEFDSYWFTDGGADVADYMERLGSRMQMWHINDRGVRNKGPFMTPILKEDAMELGYGNMNLNKYAKLAKESGIEAVVLETHKNWVDNDPVKSIQLSAEFLKKVFKDS